MGTLYAKLSPGPGRIPRQVSSHQRTRLRGAMIEIAGERGFSAVTVRKLTQLAGISTRSFYEHFRSKEECFLSTYEWLVRQMARSMLRSQKVAEDWRQQLHLSLRSLFHDLAAEPRAARLLLVEASSVGAAGLERASHSEAIFEAVINTSLAGAPEGEMSPPFVPRAIVSGATRVGRARLLAGRAEELPELVEELTEWALSFSSGSPGAVVRKRQPVESPIVSKSRLAADREAPLRQEARRNPRALVLAAVAKLAASDGYQALSAQRVRAMAGVSRKAFNAHFKGLHDCYAAAVEERATEVLADFEREGAEAPTWPAGIHRAVVGLCDRMERDRAFSRLAFAEVMLLGEDGMRLREGMITVAADRLRRSAPSGHRPSELAAEASAGAAWDAIHRQVSARREAGLTRQVDSLRFLLLAPVLGRAAATTR